MSLVKLIVIASLGLAAEGVQSGLLIKNGLWETVIHSEMKIAGMPMVSDDAQNNCISDLSPVPWSRNLTDNCSKEMLAISGGKVTWRVECKHGANAKTIGKGTIVYSGNTLVGDAKFQNIGGASDGLITKQTMKGKRIGDCE